MKIEIMLVGFWLALSLAACGGGGNGSTGDSDSSTQGNKLALVDPIKVNLSYSGQIDAGLSFDMGVATAVGTDNIIKDTELFQCENNGNLNGCYDVLRYTSWQSLPSDCEYFVNDFVTPYCNVYRESEVGRVESSSKCTTELMG